MKGNFAGGPGISRESGAVSLVKNKGREKVWIKNSGKNGYFNSALQVASGN